MRRVVFEALGGHPRIQLVEPLEYRAFVGAMKQAHFILTDSGGVQEEAPALGKPVLVLRDETERPEALAAGVVRLIGTSYEKIVAESTRLLEDGEYYASMARGVSPYGDGHAAERIAALLKKDLGAALAADEDEDEEKSAELLSVAQPSLEPVALSAAPPS